METVFYDGGCGLCHAIVRFVAARDAAGRLFEFAPLGGELFRATVRESDRTALPDSIVVHTAEGALLLRSVAVLHILRRIGGAWSALASLLGAVPVGFSDSCYDRMARWRRRLFGAPTGACPILPPHLRSRFHP